MRKKIPNSITLESAPDFMPEEILSALLGRAVSSLQKDRLRGTGIPFIRIGRLIRYRKETVVLFLAEAERTSTSASRAPEKHDA
ncbi:hypothetical protein ACFLQ0_02385 [Nitrospinota bacterium]